MRGAARIGGLVALAAAAGAGTGQASAAEVPPNLHVAAFTAPSSVTLGTRAQIAGRVSPAAAVPVLVERLEDGAWRTLVTLDADARGRVAARLPLARTSNLRLSVALADGSLSSSRRRSVAIRRRVSLSVSAPELERIAGRPFVAAGSVSGAARGEVVALQGSVNGRAYRTIARLKVRAGRVRSGFTPPSGGAWRFRLVADATAGRDVGGTATTGSMTVYGANPHNVPRSASHYLVQEISQFRLYYYEDGRLRRVFPVVFGAPGTPTPVGRFQVYSKTVGPRAAFGPLVLWYHRGYGIHGTDQEYLLDDAVRYYSHGCTRNYNANITWLWPRVPVGTTVVNLA